MSPLKSGPAQGGNHHQIHANDERTPLLAAVASAPLAEAAEAEISTEEHHPAMAEDDEEEEAKPLDMVQIFLLCYTRLVEPIAFFSIFPYITYMIEKTGGVAPEDVGFYTGLIESLFSATQMCVMIFWGKAADRFGRKPILVLSLFGVTLSTALFGMSQSLWQMIVFRCLAGIFSGTIVTVRVMLTENSTKSTQARVFGYFAFVGNLGITMGPALGSALERPAEKFPSSFGHVQFFHDYPYSLPGFASAFIGLSAAVLVTVFVKETLVRTDSQKSSGSSMTTWELFKYPGVAQCLIIYNYCMLLAFAFTAIFNVFMYTHIDRGGLELPPVWIGTTMTLGGMSQAFWLLVLFPYLHQRIGTGGILNFAAGLWPIFFALDPLCNVLRRYSLDIPFWILFYLNQIFGSSVAMAFTGVQLAINDISPSPESFGTLNALSLTLQSGLRAVIPALSTALYAIGVKYRIVYGHLFWIVIFFVAVGFNFVARTLPEKAQGRPKSKALRQQNGDEA